MDDASKELLDELRAAMESMPNDPEGLAGWLLSNYRLQKIGSAEPTEFHRKRGSMGGDYPNLKIADNPKSVFLQRAGMTRELARRQDRAAIVQQINEAAEDDISVDLDNVDDFEGMDEYEAQAMMQAQLAQGASAKNVLANNSLLVQGDGAPPTAEEAAAIAHALGGETQEIAGDLPPALQADRFKRLRAQQEVAAGGKAGVIRRG